MSNLKVETDIIVHCQCGNIYHDQTSDQAFINQMCQEDPKTGYLHAEVDECENCTSSGESKNQEINF